MLNKIKEFSSNYPKSMGYKFENGLVTLEDQDEALKSTHNAFRFAKHIERANTENFQEIACKSPMYAYLFAKDISGTNIEKCQEVACQDPKYAIEFALEVKGANIEKCHRGAVKDYHFKGLFEYYFGD